MEQQNRWRPIYASIVPAMTHPEAYVQLTVRRRANAALMLGQRRRRWANINAELVQRLVFAALFQKYQNLYKFTIFPETYLHPAGIE